eukprot:CAMPEP_0198201796 /NCGR_PEP_ID=MMETSP1445-20131203/4808_1 /TAXON_ID=36898 /ORGANISM="Pyramimonas sp., Strain CCMP2087" /LENGTH=183 /DNA_ID=CAMNT_0043872401 /DNA_START=108 /DNA_END=659 /DNA_ORIENTATION=-
MAPKKQPAKAEPPKKMPPKALTPMTPEVGVTATIIDNGLEGTTFNPVDPDEPDVGSDAYKYLNMPDQTYEGGYLLIEGNEVQPRIRVRQGQGVYVDKNCHIAGNFEQDEMHGMTKIVYTSGACYEGETARGIYQGQGTYKWPDGTRYTGSWWDNRMHGDGEYCDKAGKVSNGQYYNNGGPGIM